MKKSIKFYAAIWIVLVALFNVIAFVSTGWIGQEKYTPSFWCGYGFIMLYFIINLIYAILAFVQETPQKILYNIGFFKIAYGGLILAFVVGGLFMLIPVIPEWVCILVSAILLAGNTISVLKAKAAAKMVADLDDKVATQTRYIYMLSGQAQALTTAAKSDVLKELTHKVYEGIRYSDPMSHEGLSGIEKQIADQYEAFSEAVLSDDDTSAAVAADKLLFLLNNRNERCKVLK